MARTATFHDLDGRSVFITGGGSGIGASLTEGFLEQGCRVAFVQRSDASDFAAGLGDRHGNAPLFIPCDVTDIAALQAAMAEAAAAHGPITVLVNNAANDARHPVEGYSPEQWDRSQAVNLRPHFFTIQAAAPGMKAAGGGAIVNYSSISYLMGADGYLSYVAAKAGITGLTYGFARTLGPDNIRVNAILPGAVLTERQLELWVTPEGAREFLDRQCLKENLYPPDLVGPTLFLASDASRMVTGQTLVVDGGVVHGMTAAWIAVDWGSSNLRAWALDAAGSVIAEGAVGERRIVARARSLRAGAARGRRPLARAGRAHRRHGLRHGRRPRRLGGGGLRHGPLPADARRVREGPDRAIPGSSVRILPGPPPGHARPTSCAARRRRSPASSPPSPASTASPACRAPTPSGRTSPPARW